MQRLYLVAIVGALVAVLMVSTPAFGQELGIYIPNATDANPDCLGDNVSFVQVTCFRSDASEIPACAPFLEQDLEFPAGAVFVLTGTPNDPVQLATDIVQDVRNQGSLPPVERLWLSLEGEWSDTDRDNVQQLLDLLVAYRVALNLLSVEPRFGFRATVTQMQELFGELDVVTNFSDANLDLGFWWVPESGDTPNFASFPGTNGFGQDQLLVVTTGATTCGDVAAEELDGRDLNTEGFALGSAASFGSWTLAAAVLVGLGAALLGGV